MSHRLLNRQPLFQKYFDIFPIIIKHDRSEPRGQMKNKSILLSPNIPTFDEITKVAIHEIAHAFDIYVLRRDLFKVDISNKFYQISWTSATVSKPDSSVSDFVSGYGASNQYEDFAESFTFYIFHQDEFKKRAKKSKKLQQKYAFLQRYVFK